MTAGDRPVLNVVGEKVALGPVLREHLPPVHDLLYMDCLPDDFRRLHPESRVGPGGL